MHKKYFGRTDNSVIIYRIVEKAVPFHHMCCKEIRPQALEEINPAEQLVKPKKPMPVVYNEKVPLEFFDFIIIDECHRSIYNLWQQVLDYFDAFLIGESLMRQADPGAALASLLAGVAENGSTR